MIFVGVAVSTPYSNTLLIIKLGSIGRESLYKSHGEYFDSHFTHVQIKDQKKKRKDSYLRIMFTV